MITALFPLLSYRNLFLSVHSARTVSYTHLDVYKRQGLEFYINETSLSFGTLQLGNSIHPLLISKIATSASSGVPKNILSAFAADVVFGRNHGQGYKALYPAILCPQQTLATNS